MITVGVLGANGQVGREVCLYLSLRSDVRLIAITRTPLGSALLRQWGIECVHGSGLESGPALDALGCCDVVADFALPQGTPSVTQQIGRELIRGGVRAVRPDGAYIYMSSISALGMGHRDRRTRHHRVAHTLYAIQKRRGEQWARREGMACARRVHVFRLGQVHGLLQAASRELQDALGEGTLVLPDSPSSTIFAHSVGEAIVNVARRAEPEGTVLALSRPDWSWAELAEFFIRWRGINARISTTPIEEWAGAERMSIGLGAARTAVRRVAGGMLGRFRQEIGGYVLSRFADREAQAYARFRRATVACEIQERAAQRVALPVIAFVGTAPGPRLMSISDSRENATEVLNMMSQRVRSASENWWRAPAATRS